MSTSWVDTILIVGVSVVAGLLVHRDALLEHEINKLKIIQISLQSRIDALEGTTTAD